MSFNELGQASVQTRNPSLFKLETEAAEVGDTIWRKLITNNHRHAREVNDQMSNVVAIRSVMRVGRHFVTASSYLIYDVSLPLDACRKFQRSVFVW